MFNKISHSLIIQEKILSHIAGTYETIILEVHETTAFGVKSLLDFFVQKLHKNTQTPVYFRMCGTILGLS